MFEKEIARGAALLDQQFPGWDEHIDVERLDMLECADCIFGQFFGSYDDGVRTFPQFVRSNNERYSHGFSLKTNSENDPRWNELRDAWVRLITLRRTNGGS
jgi:hypothetical protein